VQAFGAGFTQDHQGSLLLFCLVSLLHGRSEIFAQSQNNVNRSLKDFSITTSMTKQPIMIRVVVVCQVTGCYRVEYRRLDPSAQGLVSMTAERLAAG
jgi:hypothetical protein